MSRNNNIVPKQKRGAKTGAGKTVKCRSAEEARNLFQTAKRRLLDIDNWGRMSGPGSASFEHTDKNGRHVDRIPREGDLIKIDLPGPGPVSGKGYDWVVIEEIRQSEDEENDIQIFAFRTRPVPAPGTKQKASSHFYTPDATSTFVIRRKGNTVHAAEHGRNEIPNTRPKNIAEKIRNAGVAFGAMLGLSSVQWRMLVGGLLEK